MQISKALKQTCPYLAGGHNSPVVVRAGLTDFSGYKYLYVHIYILFSVGFSKLSFVSKVRTVLYVNLIVYKLTLINL